MYLKVPDTNLPFKWKKKNLAPKQHLQDEHIVSLNTVVDTGSYSAWKPSFQWAQSHEPNFDLRQQQERSHKAHETPTTMQLVAQSYQSVYTMDFYWDRVLSIYISSGQLLLFFFWFTNWYSRTHRWFIFLTQASSASFW